MFINIYVCTHTRMDFTYFIYAYAFSVYYSFFYVYYSFGKKQQDVNIIHMNIFIVQLYRQSNKLFYRYFVTINIFFGWICMHWIEFLYLYSNLHTVIKSNFKYIRRVLGMYVCVYCKHFQIYVCVYNVNFLSISLDTVFSCKIYSFIDFPEKRSSA